MKNEKLGSHKILPLMLSMGIPTLVAQLINMLYNIVDRIYIGNIKDVGAYALTGVGLTLPIIMLITAFSNLIGAGGAPRAAIALGQGNKEKSEKILGNCFAMLLITSVLLTLLFFAIKKPCLYLFGASDNTFPYADQYLSIYLCGTVFVQIAMGMNYFITAQGRTKIAMCSILIGAFINIVLDPILIFGCKMGVSGAAVATVVSQFVSAVWVLHFLIKKAEIGIKKENLGFQSDVVKSVLSLGASPFIMASTESLISIVLNSGMQKYGGDLYVGSITILQSVMQLVNTPLNGFAQGVQPIISYNYGAGNNKRVIKTFLILLFIMFTSSFVLTFAVMNRPRFFAEMFTDNAELIQLVTAVMPIFFFGMLIFGIQMACQSSFMALGQAKQSLFMAMFRKVILLTPLAVIMPMFTKSPLSIYYAEPIADGLSAITCGLLFAFSIKKILTKK